MHTSLGPVLDVETSLAALCRAAGVSARSAQEGELLETKLRRHSLPLLGNLILPCI